MIRAFKKIGGAFKAIGRFIVKRKDLRNILSSVAVFIPVIGGPLAIALDYVEDAEKRYPASGSGVAKMAWAVENVVVALDKAGYKEKRVKGLIEAALLILKGEAEIRKIDEE